MIKNVLGFFEKDADKERLVGGEYRYDILEKELVPVRLKSESVSLKWLEEIIERRKRMELPWLDGSQEWVVDVKVLLCAVRKEAEK